MSASIWHEEVERGLKEEILRTVKYVNESGDKSFLEDSKVFVRDPEADLKDEDIPCVTITPLYERFDPQRAGTSPHVMSRDFERNIAVMQDTAVPFNLFYQLDFWSYYREDINLMKRTWLHSHFKQFNLPVVDDGGKARSCNAIVNESFKQSDLLKNQKRLFHSIISYSIWVELDDEIDYNKYMVADAGLMTELKEG